MQGQARYILPAGLILALVLGFLLGRQQSQRYTGVTGQEDAARERVVVELAPSRDEPLPVIDGVESSSPRQQSNAFKGAAARVKDAVVFVQVSVHTATTEESILDAFGDRLFRDRALPRSVGSGVIISPDGYIVTNHHVVEGARRIEVTLTDKRVFDATLVGSDPSTDIAVLQIQENDLPNAVVGNSDLVDIGEWVLAIGNPFRLRSTVTAGIVSAIGRDVDIIDDGYGIEDFIQTDAAINPGNSGGALVNLDGELVGINTAIATESGSNEGYGFAVPSNLVARVVADLIEFGEVQRGYLGVTVLSVSADRARAIGLQRAAGVELQDVAFGLAAYRAGLRAGDVVLAIDGQTIDEPNQLQSVVAKRRPGDTLAIRYWRNRQLEETAVTILGQTDPATDRWLARQIVVPEATSPDPEPDDSVEHTAILEIGLLVAQLSRRIERRFDVTGGLYVVSVMPEGSAASVGVKADVVLTSVNGSPVSSVEDLNAAIGDGDAALLEVLRRDGTRFYYDVPVADR